MLLNLTDLHTKAPNFGLSKFNHNIALQKVFQIACYLLAVIPRPIGFKIQVLAGYLGAA